ncbi:permeases of the major facilitator superfamily [Candidatus Brocadia sinica JPN1]|uniref:Permeases of the major facilitator superfamily n=1 Tax=Candidatus Brocadia sinica JPN1 TaxID=1197129 RepID=A0ABQ0K062_9BACT|nr:permeases of the major facilitator superfamily [Candidatus Brocadia sinica JPN1]
MKPQPCFKETPPISLWIIHVKEEHPPAGTKAVEWFLLTTIDIKSQNDALNCLEWYRLR